MRYYPLFADLTSAACLVVGAGMVGRRKIAALLECEPKSVTVIEPRGPEGELAEIAAHPAVDFQTRDFQDTDVDGKALVIACTDHEELNWRISRLCQAANILCNIVDQPEKCSFIVPAVYRQGDLTLAVSTGGASPALAKKIRRDLDSVFGAHYGAFLALMARIRPMVLELGRSTEENTTVFRALVDSELMDALEAHDVQRTRKLLAGLLPPELAGDDTLDELTHGLV